MQIALRDWTVDSARHPSQTNQMQTHEPKTTEARVTGIKKATQESLFFRYA